MVDGEWWMLEGGLCYMKDGRWSVAVDGCGDSYGELLWLAVQTRQTFLGKIPSLGNTDVVKKKKSTINSSSRMPLPTYPAGVHFKAPDEASAQNLSHTLQSCIF
jgi:hypothetical protein